MSGKGAAPGAANHQFRHGMTKTKAYRVWMQMRLRCRYPKHPSWPYYGGRGIKVCDRWQTFENFFADMGSPPERAQLDRIDNDDNYEPGNCRWVTPKENVANSRNPRYLTFNGRRQNLSEWAAETGIGIRSLHYRLSRGWSVSKALTTPVKTYRRRAA